MKKKISMVMLLEKFNDCEMFSLTGPINKVKISPDELNHALEEIKKINQADLRSRYHTLKNKDQLMSFEQLYQTIETECYNFGLKFKEQYLAEFNFFEYAFICDHVGIDTKYSHPHEYFWHFYHSVGLNLDRELYLNELIKLNNKLSPLDKLHYDVLKNNLIKYEILFHNHCTESNTLMINYYFHLNQATKQWLLQFPNDFALNCDLEDLAFYKNGEVVFSSCTHEQFNSLDENNY